MLGHQSSLLFCSSSRIRSRFFACRLAALVLRCGPAARCFAATATGLRGFNARCDGSIRKDSFCRLLIDLRAMVLDWSDLPEPQSNTAGRGVYSTYRDRSSLVANSPNLASTKDASICTACSASAPALKETSSNSFSITVYSRRAPIFSVFSFTE